MRVVQAPRASVILYNLLASGANLRPWLLPADICPVVPLTLFRARVPFAFVDISERTLHMDPDQAEGLIKTRKYGGLLYAHTYEEASTPDVFFKTVKSNHPGLFLLDERCLCAPDVEPPSGAVADLILLSTGYARIVELNRGGYVFIREDANDRASHLPYAQNDLNDLESAHKQAVRDRMKYEYRDSHWLETDADLPAWFAYRRQIEEKLLASLSHRAEINTVYSERLPGGFRSPQAYQTWRFNIRVKDKQRILDAIFAADLFAGSHYASLAGIMSDGCAPAAESLADEVINLLNDHHFTRSQAERVCDMILENSS
ncbi:MAG TPA: hypothetical protein PLR87_03690 [Thermoanaerobaculaceae bacterium]|nr:hypothetical protein [Thermoanaerobaculaceae bacterium]